MTCLISVTQTPQRRYHNGSGESPPGVSLIQSPARLHSVTSPGKMVRGRPTMVVVGDVEAQ